MIDNVNETLGGQQTKAPAGAPRIDAAQAAPAAHEQVNPAGKMGQTNAPSIFSILRSVSSSTAISAAGSNYITALKAKIENDDPRGLIKCYPLTYPAMSLAFVNENKAIVLLFSEAITTDANKPAVSKVKDAVATLKSTVGQSVELVNVVVVCPEDYAKAAVMGAYICNSLLAMNSDIIAGFNAGSLKDVQVSISTIPDDYDKFVETVNPHGVPARADLKLTISIVQPNRNPQSLWTDEQGEKFTIAAVGAYVTFASASLGMGFGGSVKFLPEVHISEITSLVWDDSILPLILSQVTDCLIFGGFWKAQFNNISDNAPNIGSLIVDPATNKTWKADTTTKRDQFIAQYCEQPILCLDITEGRARIPGLVGWYMGDQFPRIAKKINQFFKRDLLPPTVEIARPFYTEMTGTFTTTGAAKADTRWIDFLNMMVHHESNRQQVMALLQHSPRPEDDVAIKRQFENSISLLYFTSVVMIQPEVLNAIRQGVYDSVRIVNGRTMNGGSIDMSYFVNAGAGFMSGNRIGNYGQYSNPFGQIWGNNNLF